MVALFLLLLTPSMILAQRYQSVAPSSSANQNNEPFLPIYPIYPYSPKLIKRGTERDLIGQLTPELYAPKLDARDSYAASFGANYQRDPYYPSYNPYPKQTTSTSSSSSTFPSGALNPGYTTAASYPTPSFVVPGAYSSPNLAYSSSNPAYTTVNQPYSATGYSNPYPYSPYGVYNSYSTPYTPAPNPYSSNPYSPASYPNYNYQAPYYYPNYYNQPYGPLPPPPPAHPSKDYSGSSSDEDTSSENEPSPEKSSGSKKTEQNKKNRYKDNDDVNNGEGKDGQFVDGGNFLSAGSKDLDGQSSTYKTPSPYNQLEQPSDVHLRSVSIPGLPRTTYRVISVGGQPVGPDYPLPQSYAKVQQLEQLMTQTLAKLLAQNGGNQGGQQFHYENNQETDNPTGAYGSQVIKSPQAVIAKTGLAYVMNPTNLPKSSNPQRYINNFANGRNPILIKVQEPNQIVQQGSTILTKAGGKYADGHYGQKTVTTVSLQQAPGVYIPPEAKNIEKDESPSESSDFNDYDSNSGQNYENGVYKKNEENYSIDHGQGPLSYHNSNLVTVQTPQAQSYQYSSYLPTQSTQQQQQSRDYKTSLDDVNFGTKRNGKV